MCTRARETGGARGDRWRRACRVAADDRRRAGHHLERDKVLRRAEAGRCASAHLPPPLPSLTAHPQTAQISRDLRPEWQSAILVPLLASEPNPNVLIFAAECIEVLHKAYAAGKAYPKSQVLEAEAAASCQAGGPLVMRELRRKFTLLQDGPPPVSIGVVFFELWSKVRTEFNFLNMPESKVRHFFRTSPSLSRHLHFLP